MGKMTPHPCKRDCPDRDGACRRTCEKWKKYETIHAEEIKKRNNQARAEREASELLIERARRAKK